MKAARVAFAETLLDMARQDPALFAVTTDSRGSVTLGDFAQALPEQFVECGIAEQNAVGIAAGLAGAGLHPFVCGPACFFSLRAAEQIKVDVAYAGANVKIIGISGGVSYGALGATHHATQDIALLRALPGLTVVLPADARQTAALTRALGVYEKPTYVRMGREPVPDVYAPDTSFALGQAVRLTDGGDAAIIACGEMVHPALEAAGTLASAGIAVRVLDMHTLKPLDTKAVLWAAQAGAVVTVEEHSILGGLGAAVAEVLCQHRPTPMRILGLPDEALYTGTGAQVKAHYGLTAEGIAQAVRTLREEASQWKAM